MPSHILVSDVQQWLEPTKLTITTVEPSLEATAFEYVASSLSSRYDPAGWLDTLTTPKLVKSVESMWYAGMLYKRQYSENTDESGYGTYLLTYVATLVTAISTGQADIVDISTIRAPWSYPVFWPDDDSTLIADPKVGGDPTDPLGAPRAFTMGQVF